MLTRLKLFIYSLAHGLNTSGAASDALSIAVGAPTRTEAISGVALICARHVAGEWRKRNSVGRIAMVIAYTIQLLIVLALVVFVYGVLRWLL